MFNAFGMSMLSFQYTMRQKACMIEIVFAPNHYYSPIGHCKNSALYVTKARFRGSGACALIGIENPLAQKGLARELHGLIIVMLCPLLPHGE